MCPVFVPLNYSLKDKWSAIFCSLEKDQVCHMNIIIKMNFQIICGLFVITSLRSISNEPARLFCIFEGHFFCFLGAFFNKLCPYTVPYSLNSAFLLKRYLRVTKTHWKQCMTATSTFLKLNYRKKVFYFALNFLPWEFL